MVVLTLIIIALNAPLNRSSLAEKHGCLVKRPKVLPPVRYCTAWLKQQKQTDWRPSIMCNNAWMNSLSPSQTLTRSRYGLAKLYLRTADTEFNDVIIASARKHFRPTERSTSNKAKASRWMLAFVVYIRLKNARRGLADGHKITTKMWFHFALNFTKVL